ncbi:ABC transporter permease [Entomospira entomophila]|uniref:ABC transporter permease n=1 Tax=Entomospira entomophila TaxID=2719988 RepID=A0A968G7P9_9SPIO|nr:ABC transporter permease [Entomospira entomophilus]NIZ40130.1 ABC transporter permease [Entomospira entomophilus]WDI35689.1 ABC transporter permease [Entomospira entomophilus]
MRRNLGFRYTLLALIVTTTLTIIPLLIVIFYSFLTKNSSGGVIYQFSLDAYRTIFSREYALVLKDTLVITFWATSMTMMIALPCAYYMALSRHKDILMMIIIVPFWTNFLVRIFAWKAILEANGFLNLILLKIGLIDTPLMFLYNRTAVIVVLAYTSLPFAILPLYNAIEKFDFSLLEAARDLGSGHMRSLRKILLPNIRGGIVASMVFVAIPIFGQYIVPQLIGGGNAGTFMLGQQIANVFFNERNWPVPSAITTLLMFITLIGFFGVRIRTLHKNRQHLAKNK